MRLFSPAKINLNLNILYKRPDSYHEISSLIQAISLGDYIEIELADTDELTCTDPLIPCDQRNLAFKAVELFRKKTGFKGRFSIVIEKHTPIEAGLGGGSSNAATVLWACNQLSRQFISNDQLMQWSAEIGSDVPFFFSSGRALCTGRGEIVQPLDAVDMCKLWIIKPSQSLSTAAVYKNLRVKEREFSNSSSFSDMYENDLEEAAFRLIPQLQQFKETLVASGFKTVMMSGSGTAFFCLGSGNPHLINQSQVFEAHFLRRSNDWY